MASLLLMVIVSVTGGLTGIDPDNRWGLLRQAVLATGVAGLVGVGCLATVRSLDRRLMSNAKAEARAIDALDPGADVSSPAGASHVFSQPADSAKTLVAGTLTVAAIAVAYIGLVSVWHWTRWPPTTAYYSMLADSFTRGHVHLPIKPSPLLAELQNPYGRGAWAHAKGIANLAYYQGRYYMYWGPAPAVVLAALEALGVDPPGDEVVVFVTVSLVFLFSALTILRIRHTYFAALPAWLTIAGLLIVGTVHPMLWFQNSPSVLTAAISSGQAFLMGGVYFMVRVWTDERAGAWSYAAAGALWALAIGSRLITGAAVAVLVLGVALLVWKRYGPSDGLKAAATRMAPLLVAMGLGLSMYARYNQIRFGNLLETGFRYAFAEFDLGVELRRGTLFNLGHLAPNLLYYVFAPARPIPNFPYLRPVYYDYPLFSQLLSRIDVPAGHRVEDATGLIFASPSLLFAAVLGGKLLNHMGRPRPEGDARARIGADRDADQRMLGALMLLSGLAETAPIFLFFYTTTRYEMDFVPVLALAAVLGMWRIYQDTRIYPIQGRLAAAGIVMVVTAGTLASLLLAISGAASRFDDLNPGLYSFLLDLLPHW